MFFLDVGTEARRSRLFLRTQYWSPLHELVAGGSLIIVLDQAHNVLAVDRRCKSTHKLPTPSRQPPFAVSRLQKCDCPTLAAASVDRGFSPAWGWQRRLAHIRRIARIRGRRSRTPTLYITRLVALVLPSVVLIATGQVYVRVCVFI